MQLPDVNVLIYAHRLDAPDHVRYAAWLTALVEAPEPFAVGDRARRLPANRDKSQDLSSGDTNANSFVILPQARRVAKSRVRRAEPHTLGPVCENVQRH